MILCLDSGNTRLKWGIADAQGVWLGSGAVEQSALPALLVQLQKHPTPSRVVGSNVASLLQAQCIEVLLGMPVEWRVPGAAMCGVKNGYARPEQLGADRWAGLVAVRSMHAGSALVVSGRFLRWRDPPWY
jgi:type III pantothenate kinase